MGASREDSFFSSISHPKILLILPVIIYGASYIYLAFYHGRAFLLNSVVHEGGTYTLLQTIFYASHFLGHIPVHTVLAFYFVGVYLCMSETEGVGISNRNIGLLVFSLALLLFISWCISLSWFGAEDTRWFLLQKKQSVVRYGEGGSWNLHLPSTMMQFLFVPLYIFAAKVIFRSRIKLNKGGNVLVGISAGLFFLLSWLVNDNFLAALSYIWKDPRYLAHSVRELLTFPLTYYPIPLYFFLRHNGGKGVDGLGDARLTKKMIVLAVLFLGLFTYQAIVPLTEGIGDLAQKPPFAKGGRLSIVYLLSSHYFEHFLDTIYFSILSLIIYFIYKRRHLRKVII